MESPQLNAAILFVLLQHVGLESGMQILLLHQYLLVFFIQISHYLFDGFDQILLDVEVLLFDAHRQLFPQLV